MEYIAHTKENSSEKQSLKTHSEEVAALAAVFAPPHLKSAAYIGGLIHDIGKYSPEWQAYIRGEGEQVPHSYAGACELDKRDPDGKLFGFFIYMLQYVIYGHHTGLPDMLELPEYDYDYSAYKEELTFPLFSACGYTNTILDESRDKNYLIDRIAFDIRYLYSCIVDADHVNTAEFCTGRKEPAFKSDFSSALVHLNEKLLSFQPETKLQKARSEIQKQVYENAKETGEINLINMPTGSGKTLCSAKVAMETLMRTGKKRIIYVIPYNSVIDQTAEVFEEIFGDDVTILRHQSTYSVTEEKSGSLKEDALENWNAPFIITTAAQFFDSVYSNKKESLRKLHNMGDSILVFDEIQKLPVPLLQPCLQAVAFLCHNCGSISFLLSAVMPDIQPLFDEYAQTGLDIKDMVPDKGLFTEFYNCRYKYMEIDGGSDLIQYAKGKKSLLIITNGKKSALKMYFECLKQKNTQVYFLSTYQTANDRQKAMEEIREKLKNPGKEQIIVISTPMMEAGTDLDFDMVCRELTSLDNILLAGGRCNREGSKKDAKTLIFKIKGSGSSVKKNITLETMDKYKDLRPEEYIGKYFEEYFRCPEVRTEMVSKAMHSVSSNIHCLHFKEYAEDVFKMIDAPGQYSIFIPQDKNSVEMLQQIKEGQLKNTDKIFKYTVQVTYAELKKMHEEGVVGECDGMAYLKDETRYDAKTGILTKSL